MIQERFVVMTGLDREHHWTRMTVVGSRAEVVRLLEEARAGRPLHDALRRRLSAFVDGRPPAEWAVPHSADRIPQLQCMGPEWEAYGHAYRVTE